MEGRVKVELIMLVRMIRWENYKSSFFKHPTVGVFVIPNFHWDKVDLKKYMRIRAERKPNILDVTQLWEDCTCQHTCHSSRVDGCFSRKKWDLEFLVQEEFMHFFRLHDVQNRTRSRSWLFMGCSSQVLFPRFKLKSYNLETIFLHHDVGSKKFLTKTLILFPPVQEELWSTTLFEDSTLSPSKKVFSTFCQLQYPPWN